MAVKEQSQPIPRARTLEGVSALPDRLTLVAFALFVLFAGGAPVAIRFTYAELPPFWSGAARFGAGALVFWVLVLFRKIPIPRGQALIGATLFGALSVGGGFVLAAWGLVKTPASLASVLLALVPLLTLFFAYLHGLESLRWQGFLGSFLAVAGIAVVFGGSSSGALSIPHVLAIIGTAAFLAEAGVVAKKFPRSHPFAMNAIAMTVGVIILAAVSLLSGERWVIPSQANTWISLAYLVFLVTVIGFVLYLFVLRRWTASGTSYGFVMSPLVTVVLAAQLAGEQITWGFIAGAAMVLSGVVVGALLPSRARDNAG
ncbi:MAG: EamA family transporter [Anaerolineales bacterium]|nr:EamA family transporter [Anaerolineales bacterium]